MNLFCATYLFKVHVIIARSKSIRNKVFENIWYDIIKQMHLPTNSLSGNKQCQSAFCDADNIVSLLALA